MAVKDSKRHSPRGLQFAIRVPNFPTSPSVPVDNLSTLLTDILSNTQHCFTQSLSKLLVTWSSRQCLSQQYAQNTMHLFFQTTGPYLQKGERRRLAVTSMMTSCPHEMTGPVLIFIISWSVCIEYDIPYYMHPIYSMCIFLFNQKLLSVLSLTAYLVIFFKTTCLKNKSYTNCYNN